MGNCKSKTNDDGGAFGHEMLDENPNEYYFHKIEKRNKVQTRDTAIPQPNALRKKKKRLLACLNADDNDNSTEVVADSTIGTASSANDVGINQSVSGGGVPPVRKSLSSVRHRAAMLEQAEQEAILANGNGRPMASSGIGFGQQKINLTISPTASGGGVAMVPSQAVEGMEIARSASGSVGAHGRRGSGGGGSLSSPQRIPASRRDTNRAINASMSVASSTYSAGNEADELMLFEGSTTSAAANYITGRDRDFILDYVNNANAAGEESDCGSRSIDLSATTKSTLFGDNALSDAMVYTEIGRGGKVSAVAWRVDTSTVSDSCGLSMAKCQMKKSAEPVLAIGTEDGFVAIVNAEQSQFNIANSESSIKRSGCRELPPREGRIRSLSWSPTSHDQLAIGGDDCCAAIVDVSTLEVLAELEREDRIYSVRYSPHGQFVAVGGFDGMVAIACADTLELLAEIPRLPGLVLDLSWNPNGTTLAIGGTDKRAVVVDCCDGGDDGGDDDGSPWTVVGEIQRSGAVRCVQWDPSGTYLAVGGDDGMVAVVDVAHRRVVRDVPLRSTIGGDAAGRPLAILPQDYAGGGQGSAGADGCSVSDVTWSPDGAFLAIGGSNGSVAIVETASYAVVQEVKRTAAVTCVDWQEKYLAVGGEDRSVAVLQTSGMTGTALEGHDTTCVGMEQAPRARSEENQHYVSATNTSTSGGGSSIEESLTPNEWVFSEDFADVEGEQGQEMPGH